MVSRHALGRMLSFWQQASCARLARSRSIRLWESTQTCSFWRGYSSLPPHTELAMPALSPTMTQGNIAKWYVKSGDEIAAGTVLADIETDKATLAFENQEDGYIAAILKPEGSKDIPVGEPVAIVVEEQDQVAAFANYNPRDKAAAGITASASEPKQQAADASPAIGAAPAADEAQAGDGKSAGPSYPEYIPLAMPALSPTMEQGNIVSWQVREGDKVTAGTVLADIETDKATLAFENQDDGYIAKILAPAGSKDIKVGQPVAIIVENEADIPAFANYGAGDAAGDNSSQQQPKQAAEGQQDSQTAAVNSQPKQQQPLKVKANFRIGPAARKALQEAGLTPADVTPTGPNNIITKYDVLAAVQAGAKHKQQQQEAAAPAAPAADAKKTGPEKAPEPAKLAAPAEAAGQNYTDIPNSQVRKIIAKRLLESKLTAPSLYVTADVRLDKLSAMRKGLVAQGSKVSVNDFIMRAAALALRDVPDANVFWDSKQEAPMRQPSVDVCVAVATEGGLITPIVKAADTKSLLQISAEVKELASRARANKLKPQEFMGGTFSISNLGMYGLSEFSAIINPPQAAILAIGGSQKQVTLDEHGSPVSHSVMTVSLTADHRVYDGALATELLDGFKGYMEEPLKLVM
eukprot:GHRR01002009.1.p1 GENE.GHRR01002009.1~~GHRR01002009.1.p1  ORF type:complete len:635 (+),score=234.41 GHRR01002009.1:105-2009(+)